MQLWQQQHTEPSRWQARASVSQRLDVLAVCAGLTQPSQGLAAKVVPRNVSGLHLALGLGDCVFVNQDILAVRAGQLMGQLGLHHAGSGWGC